MSSTIMRVSGTVRQSLGDLSAKMDKTRQAILDEAVEEYRRRRFLEEVNEGYAALRNDPEAWKEELEERELWEATLPDGLEEY